jgi:hypothetical protein
LGGEEGIKIKQEEREESTVFSVKMLGILGGMEFPSSIYS